MKERQVRQDLQVRHGGVELLAAAVADRVSASAMSHWISAACANQWLVSAGRVFAVSDLQ